RHLIGAYPERNNTRFIMILKKIAYSLLLPALLNTLSVRKRHFPNEVVLSVSTALYPALNFITQGGFPGLPTCR
ncbi:hypothetical protein, partial [Sporolactobacillus inulinus]|uniref:hypothetical protein n=1 Tax=Sporolactobacillus inulinus TaxID=2078 RepID=UPI001C3F966B